MAINARMIIKQSLINQRKSNQSQTIPILSFLKRNFDGQREKVLKHINQTNHKSKFPVYFEMND